MVKNLDNRRSRSVNPMEHPGNEVSIQHEQAHGSPDKKEGIRPVPTGRQMIDGAPHIDPNGVKQNTQTVYAYFQTFIPFCNHSNKSNLYFIQNQHNR
jgi:hypothetical protein